MRRLLQAELAAGDATGCSHAGHCAPIQPCHPATPPRLQILQKLTSLPFQQCKHHVSSIDAQPSVGGGLIVFVTGQLLVRGQGRAGAASAAGALGQGLLGSMSVAPGARPAPQSLLHLSPHCLLSVQRSMAWHCSPPRPCTHKPPQTTHSHPLTSLPRAPPHHPWPQPEGETNPLKFSQTFHLMPLAGSYVVTNDLFRLNYAVGGGTGLGLGQGWGWVGGRAGGPLGVGGRAGQARGVRGLAGGPWGGWVLGLVRPGSAHAMPSGQGQHGVVVAVAQGDWMPGVARCSLLPRLAHFGSQHRISMVLPLCSEATYPLLSSGRGVARSKQRRPRCGPLFRRVHVPAGLPRALAVG